MDVCAFDMIMNHSLWWNSQLGHWRGQGQMFNNESNQRPQSQSNNLHRFYVYTMVQNHYSLYTFHKCESFVEETTAAVTNKGKQRWRPSSCRQFQLSEPPVFFLHLVPINLLSKRSMYRILRAFLIFSAHSSFITENFTLKPSLRLVSLALPSRLRWNL